MQHIQAHTVEDMGYVRGIEGTEMEYLKAELQFEV
jgi:hypothetical protein